MVGIRAAGAGARLPRVATAAIAFSLVAALPAVASAQPADQQFRLIFTADPAQEPGKVIGNGPITGAGAVRVTSGSESGLSSTYEFADGTLSVAVTFVSSSFDPDFTSCTARATSTSTVRITGGTESFAGASGTGVATSRAFLVWQRGPRGECLLGQQPPARGAEIVTVNTTLVLPEASR